MFDLLVLSFVQSATEFLPVSSSGHLILMGLLTKTQQSLSVDVALHIGTLVAVIAYFYKDIWGLITGFWHKGTEQQLGLHLIIATIPALIAGFFGLHLIETVFRSPWVIAFTSIFYGILLWLADKYAPARRTVGQMRYRDAVYIGLAQMLALIPGTSRSGVTMTCARILGITRTESARFSMLLSVPTIALGGVYMVYQQYTSGTVSQLINPEIGWSMLSAAIFGLGAIWFLMRWLQHASFLLFAVYRVILGIVLIHVLL